MELTQECLSMDKYYIYSHIREDKNEIFYIGLGTKNLSRKTTRSRYARAYAFHKGNPIWERVINKTTYKIEILCEFNSVEELESKEIELIAKYKRKIDGGILTNITEGGKSSTGKVLKGRKLSEETKRKMSLSKIGNKFNVGRKLSEEQKIKISIFHKGKKLSEEHKSKITGKPKGFPSVNRKKVINLDTGIIHDSALEAYNSYNFSFKYRAFVCRMTIGKKEFNFKYVD